MHKSPHGREANGFGVHVKDCYLWAQIQYLDSCTDYRECIRIGQMPTLSAELTTEDERTPYRFEAIGVFALVAFLASIFLILIFR
ncbi:MAG TPA: hypothetical protein VHL05_14365 [Terriglobales bacterium]|nr:hypothetical protein [Terriglobales bacterium]